jgi:beta-lactamase regulating signal transducer with metallopeptidase domain
MISQNEEEEIITKESIDQELAEKMMVDEKLLEILDNIQLFLIIGLVCLMIYLTYKQVTEYLKRKRKEEERVLEDEHRKLMKNFNERDKDNA